jgi:hypothetical protein
VTGLKCDVDRVVGVGMGVAHSVMAVCGARRREEGT